MSKLILLIIGIAGAITGGFIVYTAVNQTLQNTEPIQALGAFGDPFLSIQLADSPQNGYILSTDGTDNTWIANSGGGGGGGSISTSTTPTVSHLAYWTSPSQLGSIATGTLTESVTGLSLSATRYLIGGASALSLDSGYVIPTTTRLANHDTAYGWGDHSTQGYLTTVDISDDTNLAVSSPITLTGDTVGINQSLLSITESQISDLSHYTNGDVSSYLYGSSTLSDLIGTHYTNADVSSYLYSSTTRSDLYTAGTGLSWTGNTLNAEVQSSDLHNAVTLAGEDYLSLSTQQITANAINPDNLASADFGDFTCNGTTCSLDTTYASSLDTAYNGGASITADSGSVSITTPDASNNAVLTLTQNDVTNNPNVLHIINEGDGYAFLLQDNSDDSIGTSFVFRHNTASPADYDQIGYFSFNGEESGASNQEYARMSVYSSDVTSGDEDGGFQFLAKTVGSLLSILDLSFIDGIHFNTGNSDVNYSFGTDNLDVLAFDGGTDTATALGVWDYGGTSSFEITNGSNPTVNALGECAIDSTTGQFLCYDGSEVDVYYSEIRRSLGSIGSTSLDKNLKSFSSATTTWDIGYIFATTTVTELQARTDTGTCNVVIGDGSSSSTISAGTSGTLTTVNYTMQDGDYGKIAIGGCASTPNFVTVTWQEIETRQ